MPCSSGRAYSSTRSSGRTSIRIAWPSLCTLEPNVNQSNVCCLLSLRYPLLSRKAFAAPPAQPRSSGRTSDSAAAVCWGRTQPSGTMDAAEKERAILDRSAEKSARREKKTLYQKKRRHRSSLKRKQRANGLGHNHVVEEGSERVANGGAASARSAEAPEMENGVEWRPLDDSLGLAGGCLVLRDHGRTGYAAGPSARSAPSGLPGIQPLLVSLPGIGTNLITTSGPLLKVFDIPGGALRASKRAHDGLVISLAKVPDAVNKLQVVTCANCMTVVVWDMVRVLALARVNLTDLVDMQRGAHFVPTGLVLSVKSEAGTPTMKGWVCMRAGVGGGADEKDRSKGSSVIKSFPIDLQNLVRLSRMGGKERSQMQLPEQAKHAGCKLRNPGALLTSASGSLVAAIDVRRTLLWRPSAKAADPIALHHTKLITALAVSGDSQCVAVGDEIGQVLVYYVTDGTFSGSDLKTEPSTFHWHSDAVSAMAWGPSDSEGGLKSDVLHLYTGGKECTLVFWEMPTGTRSYLPRFPAPIVSLKCCQSAKDGLVIEPLVAVGCTDNSVLVVNALSRSKVCAVSGLQVPYDRIVYAERGASDGAQVSVFNSRRGAVQTYDLDRDCQISKLSIGYNQEQTPYRRGTTTYNPKIEQRNSKKADKVDKLDKVLVAYCAQGGAMCTVEQQAEGLNVWLKVWGRSEGGGTQLELQKTFLNPHSSLVACLEGHASKEIFVSSSVDGVFKFWTKNTDGVWICASQSTLPHSYLAAAAFSSAGSMLVGSFSDCVGFWDTREMALKTSLRCPSNLQVKAVRALVLLPEGGPTTLAAVWHSSRRAKVGLSVWNLQTLTHAWSVQFDDACVLCCAATEGQIVLSVGCTSGGSPSTKIMHFGPSSPRPERVWHLDNAVSALLHVDGDLVVATEDGTLMSAGFADKLGALEGISEGAPQAQGTLQQRDATMLMRVPAQTKAQSNGSGGGDVGMHVDYVERVLDEYRDVPSHMLPSLSSVLEAQALAP